jgi:hypothetical protein
LAVFWLGFVKRIPDIFAPFAGLEFLTREEKRRMLTVISPTFWIADYNVREMQLGVAEAV